MLDAHNPESVAKHRKRFIGLATLIFTLVGVGHLLRILYAWPLLIAGWDVPMSVSWFALFVTFPMVLMGAAYLKK